MCGVYQRVTNISLPIGVPWEHAQLPALVPQPQGCVCLSVCPSCGLPVPGSLRWAGPAAGDLVALLTFFPRVEKGWCVGAGTAGDVCAECRGHFCRALALATW